MKTRSDDPAPPAPMASAKGDLRQLKQNSSATVTELKAFLKQLKGKSPQEMMGLVAGSQLFRAICLSTALVAITAVVFTVIPFALGAGRGADKQEVSEQSAAPPPSGPEGPPSNPPGSSQSTPANADLSKLGVGEEKKAPPNLNPLEGKTDDFLKGLD